MYTEYNVQHPITHVTVGVTKCARCGDAHSALDLDMFSKQTAEGAPSTRGAYNYFARCPNTSEPLLFAVTIEGEPANPDVEQES